jgi:hypothetical protein
MTEFSFWFVGGRSCFEQSIDLFRYGTPAYIIRRSRDICFPLG